MPLMYPQHSNQPWPKYVPNDFISAHLSTMGQVLPSTRRNIMMEHGRQLAGLGHTEGYDGDSEYDERDLSQMESSDDVVGSGIFDMPGHGATVHRKLGVFEDHPNIPGYIDREIPFRPSTEVTSIPSGAEVITVPGGGMTWGGRLIRDTSPTAVQPHDRPQGGAYPVPVSTAARAAAAASAPGQAVRPVAMLPAPRPTMKPGVIPAHAPMLGMPKNVPVPVAPRPVPMPLPTVNAPQMNIAVATMRPEPIHQAKGRMYKGFGADDAESPSLLPYVLGGVFLGAAAAVVKKFVIDKK